MYRFFIKEEQIHDGMIEICGSDVNHIKNVLRMKTGDKVYLSNGSDLEYECSLLEWTDDTILAKIEDVHGMETELPVKITLYQGLPKGDKMEMIVQKESKSLEYDCIKRSKTGKTRDHSRSS